MTSEKNLKNVLLTTASVLFVTHAATAAQPVALAGSLAAFGPDIRTIGEADPQATVTLQVALRMRALDKLTERAPQGGHLGRAEMAASYFPAQSDYDAVAAWLHTSGLTVSKLRGDRLVIEATGTAATVAGALGTHFVEIERNGVRFVSADTAPSVPPELSSVILSVNGLQPQLRAHPLAIVKPALAGSPPYGPADLVGGYAAAGLGNGGAGTNTAVVIDTFPNSSDLTSFWQITGTNQSLSNITDIQVNPGTLPTPSGEESLDVETSSSIAAPSGKVRVYAAQSLAFSALDNAFEAVLSDLEAGVPITQVSISLGACETGVGSGQAETDDQFFASMQAMGATVFVSTGDSGSRECGGSSNVPAFYSTSPNVTAVGGTTLNLTGSDSWVSETGWSGSGGGVSRIFAKPAFQSGLSYAKRSVPDISSDADPNTGELVVLNGQSEQVGGTSLAAPSWAGLMALVNATRLASGKATLGALDTRLYPLLSTANFHDITSGSNTGYKAAAGYDLVTGIGTPIMSSLLPTLAAQP